jgi:hypothetical protein
MSKYRNEKYRNKFFAIPDTRLGNTFRALCKPGIIESYAGQIHELKNVAYHMFPFCNILNNPYVDSNRAVRWLTDAGLRYGRDNCGVSVPGWAIPLRVNATSGWHQADLVILGVNGRRSGGVPQCYVRMREHPSCGWTKSPVASNLDRLKCYIARIFKRFPDPIPVKEMQGASAAAFKDGMNVDYLLGVDPLRPIDRTVYMSTPKSRVDDRVMQYNMDSMTRGLAFSKPTAEDIEKFVEQMRTRYHQDPNGVHSLFGMLDERTPTLRDIEDSVRNVLSDQPGVTAPGISKEQADAMGYREDFRRDIHEIIEWDFGLQEPGMDMSKGRQLVSRPRRAGARTLNLARQVAEDRFQETLAKIPDGEMAYYHYEQDSSGKLRKVAGPDPLTLLYPHQIEPIPGTIHFKVSPDIVNKIRHAIANSDTEITNALDLLVKTDSAGVPLGHTLPSWLMLELKHNPSALTFVKNLAKKED